MRIKPVLPNTLLVCQVLLLLGAFSFFCIGWFLQSVPTLIAAGLFMAYFVLEVCTTHAEKLQIIEDQVLVRTKFQQVTFLLGDITKAERIVVGQHFHLLVTLKDRVVRINDADYLREDRKRFYQALNQAGHMIHLHTKKAH